MEEKSTNVTPIYNGRVIKVEKHDVLLPNGAASQRDLVVHPGAVAIVALDEGQNVLLVQQYRFAARKVLYEIPAGTLDPNEAPLVCASRELREETGYRPLELQSLGGIYMAPGYTTEYLHLFFAPSIAHSPLNPDEDEFIELHRVPLPKALEMIADGTIEDSKSIVGLLKVARLRGV